MRTYNSKALRIEFAAPWVKCLIIAIAFFIVSVLIYLLPPNNLPIDGVLLKCNRVILSISISLFLISVLLRIFFTQAKQIKHMIMIGLYYRRYGNPLCLRDGEFLPIIKVKQLSNTKFLLTIYAIVVNAEILQKLGVTVSSILNRRYQRFAVTVLNTDVALSYVQYTLEDVTIDKSFSFYSVDQMKPVRQTVFVVQKGDSIDLTTSGSILVAGKTRSGKTTGIISILIQALLCGRDHQYSQITIIDPKCAELSVLPHVVTVDDDVEATAILQSLKEFEAAMRKRQHILW
ncbi:MAG: FtsK/SpoIIIE domain-containing protein [Ruminococcus sp.]